MTEQPMTGEQARRNMRVCRLLFIGVGVLSQTMIAVAFVMDKLGWSTVLAGFTFGMSIVAASSTGLAIRSSELVDDQRRLLDQALALKESVNKIDFPLSPDDKLT